jgi:hypothetical protein
MRTRSAFLLLLVASALAGCQSQSPYRYAENWLIYDAAIRPFAVPADVLYVQGSLYKNIANGPLMYSYALSEVGKGKFIGIARVFSPLVSNEEDVACAIKWYLSHYHQSKRPFFLIGEGEGGKLLKQYEQDHQDALKAIGLAGSFYTDVGHKGFVTNDMVKKIKSIIDHVRFRATWGREMTEEMVHE